MNLAAASIRLSHMLGETQLGKIVASKMKVVLKEAEQLQKEYLNKMGKEVKKRIQLELSTENAGGHEYVYLDKSGSLVTTHTASAPGQYPAKLKGLLSRSIEYNVYHNMVTIAVYKNTPSPIKSLYYIPLTEKGISKKNPLREILLKYKDEGYYGAVITGSGGKGTPVKDYASYLEEGQRPFVHSISEKVKNELKQEFYSEMKRKFALRTNQKVTGYFQFVINKK